jgi:hypothetical protein
MTVTEASVPKFANLRCPSMNKLIIGRASLGVLLKTESFIFQAFNFAKSGLIIFSRLILHWKQIFCKVSSDQSYGNLKPSALLKQILFKKLSGNSRATSTVLGPAVVVQWGRVCTRFTSTHKMVWSLLWFLNHTKHRQPKSTAKSLPLGKKRIPLSFLLPILSR